MVSLATILEDDLAASGERRRGLRIRKHRPVKVYEPTVDRYFGGQTADIGGGGLRIELPLSTPLIPGNTLSVHVGSQGLGESLANRRQMASARVVWVDRDSQGLRGRLVAGVQFLSAISAQMDAA